MTTTIKKSQILIAIHEIMKQVGYVQKKDKNEFHGYKYASEASLLAELRPAMLEHGLILIPSGNASSGIDENGNTHVAVDYTLAHISGEVWPEKIRAFGCGNDRAKNDKVGDKGTYKALTGANKYLLFKLFQIETGDDPEKHNGIDEEKATGHQPDTQKITKAPPSNNGAISPSNVDMLKRIAKRKGKEGQELDAYLYSEFNIEKVISVPVNKMNGVLAELKGLPDEKVKEIPF